MHRTALRCRATRLARLPEKQNQNLIYYIYHIYNIYYLYNIYYFLLFPPVPPVPQVPQVPHVFHFLCHLFFILKCLFSGGTGGTGGTDTLPVHLNNNTFCPHIPDTDILSDPPFVFSFHQPHPVGVFQHGDGGRMNTVYMTESGKSTNIPGGPEDRDRYRKRSRVKKPPVGAHTVPGAGGAGRRGATSAEGRSTDRGGSRDLRPYGLIGTPSRTTIPESDKKII